MPDGTGRVLSLIALTALVLSAAMCALMWRAIPGNRHLPLFHTWSFGTVALVLVGCDVDSGVDSPLTYLLFLPLLFGSLAYSWRAVLSIGLVEVAGVAWLGYPPPSGDASSKPGLLLGCTALATLMATLAAHNVALRQAALAAANERLEKLALYDGLSGCLNWRGFDAALTAELARSQRYVRPLTLLALDIDRLKEINDEGGHAAGDEAIRQVTAAMRAVARQSDVVGRLGGDEFAMLLPETELQDAKALADRLHARLRSLPTPPRVTVSIGPAGLWGMGPARPEELLNEADAALYAAKRAGRDRTEMRGPDASAPSALTV